MSLHFYDFSVIFLHFRSSLPYTGNLANTPLNKKKEITTRPFAGLLRRRSSPGGVLLGRAYRGCNGEARGRVGIEEHLPWSAFECLVHGIKLVGVNGGAVVQFASVVGEGGLEVEEQGAHEHRVSLRMRLG